MKFRIRIGYRGFILGLDIWYISDLGFRNKRQNRENQWNAWGIEDKNKGNHEKRGNWKGKQEKKLEKIYGSSKGQEKKWWQKNNFRKEWKISKQTRYQQ